GGAVDRVRVLRLVLGLHPLDQPDESDELAADLLGRAQLLGRGHVSPSACTCVRQTTTCCTQVCRMLGRAEAAAQAWTSSSAVRPVVVSRSVPAGSSSGVIRPAAIR